MSHTCVGRITLFSNTTRGRDDSFGNTLLKIAMTHSLCCLRVRIFTIKNNDVPLLKFVLARTPPPVNQTLSKHDVISQRTVTIYSDDSCRVWLETM